MSFGLHHFQWVQKFPKGMVAALIDALLLPNFQPHGQPCSPDNVALHARSPVCSEASM